MRQIRNGVFETNSSSTHSIAIPRSSDKPNHVSFHIGEFGWGWREADPADYFYTALYYVSDTKKEAEERLAKLISILRDNNVEYYLGEVSFIEREYNGTFYGSLENGYIDHGYELREFVDELLNNGDKLLRFLGRGLVFTGNDNSDTEERCFVERDEEFLDDYDWHSKTSFKVKNPYYMSDHEDYEWYWKGN